ncbi:MAG: hypothetical protein F6K26_12805 [Moorea sp. SIO2I5]|nr:hypothetical protein [Moorena sp. SIO2I5]
MGVTGSFRAYAIATTPTLTLTDPKPLTRQSWQALVLGLTKEAIVNGLTG